MRRKKRLTITGIALALAVVAMVPVTAEAKPLPTDTSHEQGMPVYVTGTLSPDDRAFSRVDSARQVEIPYLSHGVGVTTAELGIATGSPDDRGYARAQSRPRCRCDGRRKPHRRRPVRRDRVRSRTPAAGGRHGYRDPAEPEDDTVAG